MKKPTVEYAMNTTGMSADDIEAARARLPGVDVGRRRMSDRELCRHCNGNGVVKLASGTRICPRCSGDCYEPPDGPLQGWVLDNIYTIARRELRKGDPRGMWGHVIRLCEKAGCQSRGVLRDNGGSVSDGTQLVADSAVDPVVGAQHSPSTRDE